MINAKHDLPKKDKQFRLVNKTEDFKQTRTERIAASVKDKLEKQWFNVIHNSSATCGKRK